VDCNGPTRWGSMPGCCAFGAGHLALASCTRFSPNTVWPAAITGAIASTPKVLEIATSVTDAGSRLALRQAAAISRRTAASRSAAVKGTAVTVCDKFGVPGSERQHNADRPFRPLRPVSGRKAAAKVRMLQAL